MIVNGNRRSAKDPHRRNRERFDTCRLHPNGQRGSGRGIRGHDPVYAGVPRAVAYEG